MKVPSSKFQVPITDSQSARVIDLNLNLNPPLHLPSFRSLRSFAAISAVLLFQFHALAATNADLEEIPPLRPAREEIPPTFWEQHALWVGIFAALGLLVIVAAVYFFTRPKPLVVLTPQEEARRANVPAGWVR